MNMFNDVNIKFKYTWRPYQEKVLKEIKKHLRDKKIHIVAAPGSGKTVLGLEIARQLNNAVLILSPTLTIKHQWIDRFVELFLPDENEKYKKCISENIYDLKYFNCVTYQGLHYAYKRKRNIQIEDEETDDEILEENNVGMDEIKAYDIVKEIKAKNIKTIVLDEAHHLKSEWWQSLSDVIKEFNDITIVSLTATPPYDVEYNIWKKYINLCGDIDAEITVPELVAVDNLCPHQDYIYFNYPTAEEKGKIEEYKKSIKSIIEEIKSSQEFINTIQNHPFIQTSKKYEEQILENPKYYSSMLIFLNSVGEKIDRNKVKVLGHNTKIPDLNIEWLEILLQNCIYDDRANYESCAEIIESIKSKINESGAIENNKVIISNNKNIQKNYINSVGKLSSINSIIDIEYENLKQDLRMVILTDFIRKEYLEDENMEINKLGVFPIFINLLRKNPNMKVAILTGQIFAIPSEFKEVLLQEAGKNGVETDKIVFEEMPINSEYVIVKTIGIYRNQVMNSIADIFAKGYINIIIGTKSLLGEGWDEPSINSLILASFVGSYMLSNQMRGRAIRTNDNPKKTANIWHLVCVDNTQDDFFKSSDYEMLQRRMECFLGIGYNSETIENGISRIDIIPNKINDDNVVDYTNKVKQFAVDRNGMYDKWKRLSSTFKNKKTNNMNVVQEIEINKSEVISKFKIFDIKELLQIILWIIIALIASKFLKNIKFIGFVAMWTIRIVLLIKLLKIVIRAIRIYIPKNSVKQISKITLYCLCKNKMIQTKFADIKVYTKENEKKSIIETYIVGATPYENNIFTKSMSEIFSQVESQRYIIVKNKFDILNIKSYYNVPDLLAQNKEMASEFFELWNKKIEKSKLIYTHTTEGRRILLNARNNSFDYNNKIFSKKKAMSDWE